MSERINLRHLHHFWVISREGSIARASEVLDLAPQTLSGQLATFESALDGRLFRREGRSLVLTDLGRMVRGYADEIFATTSELEEALRGASSELPLTLNAGVSASIHKLVAYRLLQPALRIERPVNLHCRTGRTEDLVLALKRQELDVVLTDRMPSMEEQSRLSIHPISGSTISLFAAPELAATLREGFPRSLNERPFLANAADALYHDQLMNWFASNGVRMRVVGEIDDSALIKVFGRAGFGVFAAPTVIRSEVCRQYEVECVGDIEDVREELYAVTRGSTLNNEGVRAICTAESIFSDD